MLLRVKRESSEFKKTYEKEKKKMKATEDLFKGLLAQRKKLFLELKMKCPKDVSFDYFNSYKGAQVTRPRRRRRSAETPDTVSGVKEDVINKGDIGNATELYENSLREKIEELNRQISTANNSCVSLHRVKREAEDYKTKLAKLQAEKKKKFKMIKLEGSIINMKIKHAKKHCTPEGRKTLLKGVPGGTMPQRRVPPRTGGQRIVPPRTGEQRTVPPRTGEQRTGPPRTGGQRVPQRRVEQTGQSRSRAGQRTEQPRRMPQRRVPPERQSQKRGKRSTLRNGQEEGMQTKDYNANSTKTKEMRETSDKKSARGFEDNPEIQRLEGVQKSLLQELNKTKAKCANGNQQPYE